MSPPASSSQTQPAMSSVSFVSTVPTPRPALTPTRGQTPTHCPAVPPEKSPHAGLCSPSRPGLHLRPDHKELSQSGLDSSGYSSSEGPLSKPKAAGTSATSRIPADRGSPGAGYRNRVSSAFFSLMGEYRVCTWEYVLLVCFGVCVCACLHYNVIVSHVLYRLSLIDGRRSTVKNNASDSVRYGDSVNV